MADPIDICAEARKHVHSLTERTTELVGQVIAKGMLGVLEECISMQLRISELEKVLGEVKGCFEAAEVEGLSNVLAETTDERLKDLIERRVMHAYYAVSGDVCAQMRALCSACGGTGDVHRADGEWLGECDCPASQWRRDALDAERYRHLRDKMRFSSSKTEAPTMTLAAPLPAPEHDLHKDWMGDRFDASVDRTVDADIRACLTAEEIPEFDASRAAIQAQKDGHG